MKTAFVRFHETLNTHLAALGTYPADHDSARDAFAALGDHRAADAAQVIFDSREAGERDWDRALVDAELERDLGHLPSPSFTDVCIETAYGSTQRLPFQIRVF